MAERRVDPDVETEIGNPAVLWVPIPVDTRATEERVQRFDGWLPKVQPVSRGADHKGDLQPDSAWGISSASATTARTCSLNVLVADEAVMRAVKDAAGEGISFAGRDDHARRFGNPFGTPHGNEMFVSQPRSEWQGVVIQVTPVEEVATRCEADIEHERPRPNHGDRSEQLNGVVEILPQSDLIRVAGLVPGCQLRCLPECDPVTFGAGIPPGARRDQRTRAA